jgi:parvulin-like peptidyl-prolyl isomerase
MKFRGIAVLCAAAVSTAVAADIKVVEEIAAKVNGDIITRGELEQQSKELEQGLRTEGYTGARLTDALKEYNANALRDQIDQLLLVQRGKDLNVNVDNEITKQLQEMMLQAKITDPDKFHDAIREQYGITFEEFRDKMKRRMLSQRVIGQEVSYRVTIPEADMRKYYEAHKSEYVRKEQVFLSQIVISTEGKTVEQVAAAEKKAKDLAARAKKGEKFSDLARDNSDDTETNKNGGQLPPYTRGLLEASIESIVFKEPKGFVTDPVKIRTGFVILRIDERYEAGQASFEEVKQDVQEKMAGPVMEPKVREFLTRLRQEAFLEIKEGYIDSGAAPGKDTHWKDVATLKPQTVTKEEVAARTKYHKKLAGFIPTPVTKKNPVPVNQEESAPPAAATPPTKQ